MNILLVKRFIPISIFNTFWDRYYYRVTTLYCRANLKITYHNRVEGLQTTVTLPPLQPPIYTAVSSLLGEFQTWKWTNAPPSPISATGSNWCAWWFYIPNLDGKGGDLLIPGPIKKLAFANSYSDKQIEVAGTYPIYTFSSISVENKSFRLVSR